MSEEIKKGIFGITKDTKANNIAQILVASPVEKSALYPSGWKFPVGNLVNVISNPAKEKKDGTTVPVLQFVFRDKDKRQHTHIEWEIETTDAKFSDKVEYMQVRIKHIYTTIFGSFPKEGIGTTATTFVEFFNEVANAFNKVTTGEGENVQKVYPKVDVYIKLTYYKKNLGFPLSPNFLERAIKGKPCKLLTIDSRYDKLEPSTGGGGITGMPGIGGGDVDGDLPAFDTGFDA